MGTTGEAPAHAAQAAPGNASAFAAAALAFGDSLCDRCVGRLAGRAEPRDDPLGKGRRIRAEAELAPPPSDEVDCTWCEGFFTEVERFATLAEQAVEGYGFDSFLVATKMHPDVLAAEARAMTALGAQAEEFEPLKMELNRVLGALLVERFGKRVDLKRPDLIVQVDPYFDLASVSTSALFLYGRYRKYDRTIPQTRWPCRSCRGDGCARCDGTGQQYLESVESLVAAVPVAAFGARDASFHGGGREDIDALMLGSGRPFVLEIKEPRVREPRDVALERVVSPADPMLELAALQARMNAHAAPRAEVLGLCFAQRDDVARVKNAATDKVYRAHVEADSPVTRHDLETAIEAVTAKPLEQRTPERVAHRRADKVRRRRVLAVRIVAFGEHARAREEGGVEPADASGAQPATRFTLEIEAEAGTYIKELVHSDQGRTVPSFAGLLGIPMRVAYLDVVGVAEPPGANEAEGAPASS